MARKYSGMTARDIQEREETSAQDATKKVHVTAILDRVDAAASLDEIKSALADFITHETGIQ